SAYDQTLQSYGVSLSHEETIQHCFYRPYEEVCTQFGIDDCSKFALTMSGNLRRGYELAPLFDHAHDVLTEAKEAGLRLCLVTSASREDIDFTLQRLRIADLFDVTITGND